MTRIWRLAILAVLVAVLIGCGGSRATGRFSNQDKPKPVQPE